MLSSTRSSSIRQAFSEDHQSIRTAGLVDIMEEGWRCGMMIGSGRGTGRRNTTPHTEEEEQAEKRQFVVSSSCTHMP